LKGADVLAYTKQGLLGVQRKSVPHDFLASISDGRMVRETSLLPKECKFPLLLLEGRFRYYPDGHLSVDRHTPSRYTRGQIRGMLFDIQYIKGVPYDYTENTGDTVSYIRSLVDFMNQGKHLGMFRRPHAEGSWYVPSSKDVQLWVLQSFQGVGPATADKILKHFGEIPLKWTCTLEELCQVPTLTKNKAKEIYSYLPPGVQNIAKSTEVVDEFNELRRRLKR
jgi:ERCC4-type nuclease